MATVFAAGWRMTLTRTAGLFSEVVRMYETWSPTWSVPSAPSVAGRPFCTGTASLPSASRESARPFTSVRYSSWFASVRPAEVLSLGALHGGLHVRSPAELRGELGGTARGRRPYERDSRHA